MDCSAVQVIEKEDAEKQVKQITIFPPPLPHVVAVAEALGVSISTPAISRPPVNTGKRSLTEVERAEIVKQNMRSETAYFPELTEEVTASEKKAQYFMGFNGLGCRKTEMLAGNKMTVVMRTDKVPGLDVIPESIDIEIASKIPGSLLREIMAGFKAIWERDQTEAAAQIYRRCDDDTYFVYYPKQKNTGATTDYQDDADAMLNLRQTHPLVMEIHSHGGMPAFFSGTDNENEKAPMLYVVIGAFNTNPEILCRVKYVHLTKDLKVEEIFETENVDALLSTENLPEPPKELLENAKPGWSASNRGHRQTPTVPGYDWRREVGWEGCGFGYHHDLDDDDFGMLYPSYREQHARSRPQSSRLFTPDLSGPADIDADNKRDALRTLRLRGTLDARWLAARLTDQEALMLMESLLKRTQFAARATTKQKAKPKTNKKGGAR